MTTFDLTGAWPKYTGPRPATCDHCRKLVNDDRERYCNHCGAEFWDPTEQTELWRIELGRVPGLSEGDTVELITSDDGARVLIIKPGVGSMASAVADSVTIQDRHATIRDRDSAVDLDLVLLTSGAGLDWTDEKLDPVLVWSYPGRTQADAADLFAEHALELAEQGYEPVSQSWAEGRPGKARVLLLGLDAAILRPKGFLTVTYKLQISAGAATVPAAADPDPIEQIRRLGSLRDAGLITAEEFERKKGELLSRL